MPRRFSIVAGMLALLFVSGLTAALPLASAQSTVAVTIPSGAGSGPSAAPGYSPDTITVVMGVNNTVTWTNDDTVPHTVTADNETAGAPVFNSGNLASGADFTYTFTTSGTYSYHCNYHSWMTGTVIVLASNTPVPEFPVAWLAVILFAVVAAAILAAPRLRGRTPVAPASGTARTSALRTTA